MPVKLAITGRSPVTITEEHIPIGSDPCCAVVLADAAEIKPIHAVIKEISGRWLIEACDIDLLTVGNAEPGRRHWLKPGDVIRLTKNSPPITFLSANKEDVEEEDDFLPVIPRFADAPAAPPFMTKKASRSDDLPLAETVDMATPITSTAIPTTQAPKSGSMPVVKPKSSGELPVAKPPLSGTIKSTAEPKENSFSKSGSHQATAARRSKSSSKSGQISTRKPTDEEIEQDLPVLTRMNSWDEEDLAPAPRRGRSSDKAEMEWIMGVVFRCAGGGVVLLIAWLAFSSLWKAFSQPDAGLPSATAGTDPSPTAVNTVVTPPSTSVVPRPTPKPAVPGNSQAKVTPEPKADVVEPNPDTDIPDVVMPEETAAGEMSEKEMSEADDAADAKTAHEPAEDGSLSPIIQATVDSLYAVVMQDATGTQQIHLGTAWAASDRHLVTSGKIGAEVKALQKKGFTAIAIQPSTDWALRIKGARIHAKYLTATAEIANAIANQSEKKQAQAEMVQLRHSLAVLDLDPAHQLDKFLPFVIKPFKTTKETVYSMVGFPLEINEGKPPIFAKVGPLLESHSKRLSATGSSRLKEPVVNIKFANHVTERDWSGSPVMDKDNQVIGVYAELPSHGSASGKQDRQDYVVVWLGLLKELAPEVLKKSDLKPGVDDDR